MSSSPTSRGAMFSTSDLMDNIKAIAGVSTVVKKNGYDQRKLIMQCAANYMFGDPTERAHLGMGGGSSLARFS